MAQGTHRLIAKHAVMFARECYETAAMRPKGAGNAFYAEWPDMDEFCRKNWHMFVPDVRRVFVDMLTLPDEQLPQARKDEIAEALCYDGVAKFQFRAPESSARQSLLGSTALH